MSRRLKKSTNRNCYSLGYKVALIKLVYPERFACVSFILGVGGEKGGEKRGLFYQWGEKEVV